MLTTDTDLAMVSCPLFEAYSHCPSWEMRIAAQKDSPSTPTFTPSGSADVVWISASAPVAASNEHVLTVERSLLIARIGITY